MAAGEVERDGHRPKTGSAWRGLPERYGPYTTVYNRFNRWAKAGVWLEVFETQAKKSPNSMQFIASLIIRAHQQAAAPKGGGGSYPWPFLWRTEHQGQRDARSSGLPLKITLSPGDVFTDRGPDARAILHLIAAHAEGNTFRPSSPSIQRSTESATASSGSSTRPNTSAKSPPFKINPRQTI
ncbi:transposase [Pseudooceanicola onchidii]|uniref:transposase n=1 Tax=Pseudooceanicola onchidii TaxID=2562279 RepID=UPI003B839AB3